MPEVQGQTILDSWVHECGRGVVFPGPDFWGRWENPYNEEWRRRQLMHQRFPGSSPSRFYEPAEIDELVKRERIEHNRVNPSFLVRVNEQNVLVAQLEKGRSRPVVELARHIGKRGEKKACVLMNGDGFDNPVLQQLQAQVRGLIQNEFRDMSRRLIVPYAALTSARLNLDSIRPIHISEDKRVGIVVKVPRPPDSVIKTNTADSTEERKNFEHKGRQYRSDYSRYYPNQGSRFYLMHHAEFAANETWHEITERVNELTQTKYWTVTESVHRLGSSLFSAEGPDGARHRWLSSFDQNENPAMYFLAQIPDKGGARYITHALRLLAPKIVQKAREDGRRVFRQGDIFAVETDLTDEDFASHTVAERGYVFQGFTEIPRAGARPGETQTVNVPRLTEEARADLKLRRSIMIYGTGHTADHVVQTPNGTYVKGVMYHDPILENIRANRPPEHRGLALGDGEKWFLAVRNAVPRQSTNTTGGSDNGTRSTQQLPDLQHNVNGRERNVPQPVVS